MVCLVVMSIPIFISDKAQVGPEPLKGDYPVGGVKYLREAELAGNLFNTYHWGGYLAWVFYPDKRVFVDGRADVYGDELVSKYIAAYSGAPTWKQILDEYRIEVLLIEKESTLATLAGASGEWKEVFRGPIESVFVRTHR